MRINADDIFANAGNIEIRLDDLIQKEGITRTKLARLLNVDYRRIRLLCGGESTRIDFDLLVRICYTLDCAVGDVLEYIPPEPEPG